MGVIEVESSPTTTVPESPLLEPETPALDDTLLESDGPQDGRETPTRSHAGGASADAPIDSQESQPWEWGHAMEIDSSASDTPPSSLPTL